MIKGTATMTVDNGLSGPPLGAILAGVRTVEGRITVEFDTPALRDWFRQERGRQENIILRMARPHLPKRVWQRLRGRMKAKWSAEK